MCIFMPFECTWTRYSHHRQNLSRLPSGVIRLFVITRIVGYTSKPVHEMYYLPTKPYSSSVRPRRL
jgi:hypothetical protein